MISFVETVNYYGQSGEATVHQAGDFCVSRFRKDGFPVLIPAYNEESDLPVTLLALARSTTPIQPYVVDNGSDDRTAEFATEMGAVVIEDERPAQIYALASGLDFLAHSEGKLQMLLTDADTVMSKRWAESLARCLEVGGSTSAVGGTAISHAFSDEEVSWTAALVRTTSKVVPFYSQHTRHLPARGRGHNMGFRFENSAQVDAVLNEVDYTKLSRSDTEFMEKAKAQGAIAIRATSPHSIVFSRGDRMPTLKTVLKAARNNHYRKIELYRDWFERAETAAKEPTIDEFINTWGEDVRDRWASRYDEHTLNLLKPALQAVCMMRQAQSKLAVPEQKQKRIIQVDGI